MPTTANTITYYVAADGTLRDGQQGSIAQTPRINYGTEYAVTLSFPPSTIAEGDQLQVALNRSRTFFSSASATGDAPVAAVAKHDVTAEEAAAQAVTLTLSTNTRAMIDQVNGIDHPVRGFFGVHVLRGQSFVTLAVADALMMSLESGPDAISPPLPILDYPTRQEMNDAVEAAQNSASAAKTSEDNADASASAAARDAQAAGQSATNAGNSATLAESYAVGGTGTRPGEDTDNAKYYLEQLGQHETNARASADEAAAWAEGTPQQVAPYGGENSAKGYATEAAGSASSANTSATQAAGSAGAASRDATAAVTAKNAAETAQGKAETAQGKAEAAQEAAETAQGKAEDAQEAAETAQEAAVSAKDAAQTAQANAEKIAEGSDADVAPLGLEHSAKGWAEEAAERMTVITIPAATTSYTLQDNKHYQQVPDSAPTYTLPTATMDGLVHEITVLVDFMHVTSCSFVDASGVPVTLQSSISPQIGEAYIFRCYWYGKWRVVPMKIRNAATASSATGVVEVSDAVAGNALALKMVAPRSVVMNQQFNPAIVTGGVDYTGASNSGLTNNDSVFTISVGLYSRGVFFNNTEYLFTAGTKVLLHCTCKLASQENLTTKAVYKGFLKKGDTTVSLKNNAPVTDFDTAQTFTNIFTIPETATYLLNIQAGGQSSAYLNLDFTVWDIEVINLTQYFNGNQTLIDSITSWDDLVAYDPRFASYVAYNTGEVVGVQPQVTITDKTGLTPAQLAPRSVVVNQYGKKPSEGGTYTRKQAASTVISYDGDTVISTLTASSSIFPDIGYDCTLQAGHKYAIYSEQQAPYAGYMRLAVASTGSRVLHWEMPNDNSFIVCSGVFTIGSSDKTYVNFFMEASSGVAGTYVQKLKNLMLVDLTQYFNGDQTLIDSIKTWNDLVAYDSAFAQYIPYNTGEEKHIDPYGATSYQAHAPLFAVGNAADEFEAVAGVTTRKMGSYTFMGNEDIRFDGNWRPVEGTYTCVFSSELTPDFNRAFSGIAWINAFLPSISYGSGQPNIYDGGIGVAMSSNNSYSFFIRVPNSTASNLTELLAWLTGKTIYYELATPTTSQSTPTQISLQAGNNTAMQIDGGRTLAELSMTYENLPAAN